MKYELAVELKEAGFPQQHSWVIGKYTEHCTKCASNKTLGEYEACRPTLSELIEACGAFFGALTNRQTHWVAVLAELTHLVEGSTPEEAVARLWLALNIETNG